MAQGSKDQTLDLGSFSIHSYDVHILFCMYTHTVFQGSLCLPVTSFVSPSVSVSEHQSVHFVSHFPLSVFFLSLSLSLLCVLCITFASQCCCLHSPVIVLLCTCILHCCDLFSLHSHSTYNGVGKLSVDSVLRHENGIQIYQ